MAEDTLTRQLEYRIAQLETKLREMPAGLGTSPVERLGAFSSGSCTNNCTAACTIGCTKGCTGACAAEVGGEIGLPQAPIATMRGTAQAEQEALQSFNKLAGR